MNMLKEVYKLTILEMNDLSVIWKDTKRHQTNTATHIIMDYMLIFTSDFFSSMYSIYI